MKSLIILLAICYHSIANPIANIDPDLEQKRLETYLTSMRDQTDLKIDPCHDFYQYACGTIHKKLMDNTVDIMDGQRTFYAKITNTALLKQTFANMEPTTRTEKIVKHYYDTCVEQMHNKTLMIEQLDSMNALAKFPVDREPTDKELMDLMTDLVIALRLGILMPLPLGTTETDSAKLEPKNGIMLYVLRDMDIFRRSPEMLELQMTEFGVPKNQQELVMKQINEFYSELDDAAKIHEDKTVDVKNVQQLKEIAPDFNWDMFLELLQSKITVPTDMLENLKIHDPNLLKRVTTILKKTDKKVLANFMLSRLLSLGADMDCGNLRSFFMPILLQKLLEKYVNEEDFVKHMVILSDFKLYMSLMKSALKMSEHQSDGELNRLEYLLKNRSKVFDNEYLDNYYKGYDLEKNMVFLNTWSLAKNMVGRLLKKFHNSEFVTDFDLHVIMGKLSSIFNLNTHDMPVMSYLFTTTARLWEDFFNEHPQYEIDTAETCLKQQGIEMQTYRMKKYLLSYAVNKITYINLMLKLSHIGGSKKNAKFLEKLGFKDFRQVYFVGMAQDRCAYGEEADGDLMRAFQHMEEFQEAFNCPTDSAMNKIDEMKCDIENCADIKENSLHIVPYTNEKCMKPVSLKTILNPNVNL